MSATDFPKSAALASEGICPLCAEPLQSTGDCIRDGVLWGAEMVDGRLVLRHSRPLTKDEIKQLHDRGGDVG